MAEYNEVNLIDYLKVIIKNKRTILIFLLIGIVFGFIITLSLPKKHNAETILEIGQYGQRLDNLLAPRDIMIISPNKFTEKIDLGIYGKYSNLEAEALKSTNLIRITISSNDAKKAEDSLKVINQLVLEEHGKDIEERKQKLEKFIEELENKIQSLSWMGRETGALELDLYYAKNQIEDFQITKIIRYPTIFFGREPNLGLNLIFGAVLGVFIGIFFILFKDWWRKNKDKIET
jgi:uncharacterized protein involved in exopolysaccharide biosynthesis